MLEIEGDNSLQFYKNFRKIMTLVLGVFKTGTWRGEKIAAWKITAGQK